MNDPAHELGQIAADLRAIVEANQAQGFAHEPPAGLVAEPVQAGLDGLRNQLVDCARCGLCAGRRNVVFGVGDADADLMIIGEVPDFHEDQQGAPFVGEAGQMLDLMLQRVISLDRSQVYITNIVKCRPPNNRNPTVDEIATCLPFLRAQIEAVRPKVLLIMGNVAFKTLFETSVGIAKARGEWLQWNGIATMPTFNPAYLLRKPQDKRLTFEDLKAVRARYEALTQ